MSRTHPGLPTEGASLSSTAVQASSKAELEEAGRATEAETQRVLDACAAGSLAFVEAQRQLEEMKARAAQERGATAAMFGLEDREFAPQAGDTVRLLSMGGTKAQVCAALLLKPSLLRSVFTLTQHCIGLLLFAAPAATLRTVATSNPSTASDRMTVTFLTVSALAQLVPDTQVVKAAGNKLTVTMGRMTVEVRLSDVAPSEANDTEPKPSRQASRQSRQKSQDQGRSLAQRTFILYHCWFVFGH